MKHAPMTEEAGMIASLVALTLFLGTIGMWAVILMGN